MATATTSGTPAVPDVVLLRVADRDLRADEVVRRMARDGDLATVRARAASGVAARRLGDAPEEDRRTHEAAFRHARHLTTAEEMERWLAGWQLSVAQWRGAMRRSVALQLRTRDVTASRSDKAAVDDDLLWAELVCGGALARTTRGLVRRTAAALALGLHAIEPPADVLEQWSASAVSEAHVDRELSDRALDWLHVQWVTLDATDQDAASEARLCLDEDGASPGYVAALLGTSVVTGHDFLHRAPAEVRDALVEVEVGRTSPPRPNDDGLQLVHVLARTTPDGSDPELRRVVREHLADQALDIEVRDRVHWHVDF